MINFKLSELRKKSKLTQQELGDILNVSYQTISKWENGVVSPDISQLPQISRYFKVSVDALLGLVPLEENYNPSNSGTKEYWESRIEYIKRTRKAMRNEDYMQFLIHNVWNIDKPIRILDCGCGQGALGLLMLPLLPTGCEYVGIDFSQSMIDAAYENFKDSDYDVTLIKSNFLDYSTNETFDMVISQTVLRHVDHGHIFLHKMVKHVKDGGLVVSIECNRVFEASGLYIDGMKYENLRKHDGLDKLWATELKNQNRDYSIAMKIPHHMKRAGLRDISCRMNDKVSFFSPEQKDYTDSMENLIKSEDWSNDKTEKDIENKITYFMNHGMTRKDAEDYCNQQLGIITFLTDNRDEVALTKFTGMMISFGWK